MIQRTISSCRCYHLETVIAQMKSTDDGLTHGTVKYQTWFDLLASAVMDVDAVSSQPMHCGAVLRHCSTVLGYVHNRGRKDESFLSYGRGCFPQPEGMSPTHQTAGGTAKLEKGCHLPRPVSADKVFAFMSMSNHTLLLVGLDCKWLTPLWGGMCFPGEKTTFEVGRFLGISSLAIPLR